MNMKICLMPGDGIGPEIMAQAVMVLEKVAAKFGHTVETETALIGGAAIDAAGNPLPAGTVAACKAADAVLHTYQGLRVPADALRVSADGTTGVYCVDGENASFRPIELVYQGEGYALVKPAEGVRDTQTLRSGDQVIATSGELYDGKVIR